MGTHQIMRSTFVAIAALIACGAWGYAHAAADTVDIADLGDAGSLSNADDCDSMRESLAAFCKMMPGSCDTMKAKLSKNCPAERHDELIQTEEAEPSKEVEDVGADNSVDMDSGVGRRGALMTSGSFTMMSTGGNRAGNEEELGEDDDEEEAAEDWNIDGNGKCQNEEAWMQMDAEDASVGKCVEFAADVKCAPQCFNKGKSVDETDDDAICSKICRVPGANGAHCNVIKMVMPQYDSSVELGEGKKMWLTRSKVMQAGLKKGDLASADPMACAGVATNRRQ